MSPYEAIVWQTDRRPVAPSATKVLPRSGASAVGSCQPLLPPSGTDRNRVAIGSESTVKLRLPLVLGGCIETKRHYFKRIKQNNKNRYNIPSAQRVDSYLLRPSPGSSQK